MIGIMTGIVVYVVCSAIFDAIILFTKVLNKKQTGALGTVLNMMLMIIAMHFRDILQGVVGNVWFGIVIVCLIINMIVGVAQFALGMMSADPYK